MDETRQKWISALTGQIAATTIISVGVNMDVALTEFDELMASEFAVVDLARFGNAQDEPSIQNWFSSIQAEAQSIQPEPERDKLLARAIIARACQFRWKEPSASLRWVALVHQPIKQLGAPLGFSRWCMNFTKRDISRSESAPELAGQVFGVATSRRQRIWAQTVSPLEASMKRAAW